MCREALKLILLSGGNGKRLWPLSSEILPKQFVKIMQDDDSEPQSMIQRTWKILASRFGESNLCIVAGEHQASVIREQLRADVPLILEPFRRDTFAAVALASHYLRDVVGLHPDETIVMLPVDAFADESFYDKIEELDQLVRQSFGKLALIGIRPTFPSEKYGYISAAAIPQTRYMKVDSFYEKPDAATADELIRRGALWNCGVFACRLGYMLDLLAAQNRPASYAEMLDMYDSLPRISFDYMVVEPEKDLACVEYEGRWTDLGTWSEMALMLGQDDSLVVRGDNCEGTYVFNKLNVPIIVTGIPNAVIVAGPEGILISDNSVSHLIKPLVDRLDSEKEKRARI